MTLDADGRAQTMTEEEKEEKESLEREEAPPADLKKVQLRQQAGSLNLSIHSLSEGLPKVQGPKEKPAVKTHIQDAGFKPDKLIWAKEPKGFSIRWEC